MFLMFKLVSQLRPFNHNQDENRFHIDQQSPPWWTFPWLWALRTDPPRPCSARPGCHRDRRPCRDFCSWACDEDNEAEGKLEALSIWWAKNNHGLFFVACCGRYRNIEMIQHLVGDTVGSPNDHLAKDSRSKFSFNWELIAKHLWEEYLLNGMWNGSSPHQHTGMQGRTVFSRECS